MKAIVVTRVSNQLTREMIAEIHRERMEDRRGEKASTEIVTAIRTAMSRTGTLATATKIGIITTTIRTAAEEELQMERCKTVLTKTTGLSLVIVRSTRSVSKKNILKTSVSKRR